MKNKLIIFTSVLIQIFIFYFIIIPPTRATTNWQKYLNNPILIGRGNAFWEGASVVGGSVIKKNNQYQMWFTGNNGSGWEIGYATSSDGINNWNISSTPVITIGSPDGWEKEVIDPAVIYDSASGQYKMWYTSSNTDHWSIGSDRFRVRYAISTDGINWNINPGWVLYGTVGSWDEGGINRGISVIKVNNIYHMWYSATNINDLASNPFWRIGYATSIDGINWIKQNNGNPVIEPTKSWEGNNISAPNVIYENGVYKIWYDSEISDSPNQIAYATSTNGISWIKPTDKNPAVSPSIGFDSVWAGSPSVINDNGLYKMWYSGYDNHNVKIGYATMNDSSSLPVPLLKQTASPWGNQVYDSAEKWAQGHDTIGDYGCAMTSAAMILQYYGITKLPDNTSLDPGTLNTWLKNQPDGYVGEGLINWLAISRLSKLAKTKNPTFAYDGLEFARTNNVNTNQLTTDLINKQPDILEEPGHFIVAKGINGDTFDINDPYFDRTDLSKDYSNTFLSLNRYIPSHTDLSYIMLTINPNVTVTVKTASGSAIGDQFIQQPYTDPLHPNMTGGHAMKIVYLPKPASDNYQITLSADANQLYQLHTYVYDQSGNVYTNNFEGTLSQNNNDLFTLNFNNQQIDTSLTTRIVTFPSFIKDVNENVALQQVNKNIGNALISVITSAKESNEKGQKLVTKLKLDAIEVLLNGLHGKGISETAFKILLYDEQYLKNHL